MTPLAIHHFTLASALGIGQHAHREALAQGRGGLAARRFETAALDTWLGVIDAIDTQPLAGELAAFDCRNNRLAALTLCADDFDAAVRRAAARFGAARVGVIVGTSTSGILQSELAYRERDAHGALPPWLRYAETHDNASLARFVQAALGLTGPAFVVSTACSSGAKAHAAAARLIALGLIDAAVVGAVDTLCLTTLYGFHALELLSTEVCRPWDVRRNGLSLGEGAAFALLQRDDPAPAAWLLGCGESSDGHHMSSPHPEGLGAVAAMRAALADAGLDAARVGYINLHGTGTRNNDSAEDAAVCAVFGRAVPASSTKGQTGHALGAAGALEAALTLLALRDGVLPAGLHCEQPDPALHAHYLHEPRRQTIAVAASNSFGFGGSNCCLVFGAA
ncbi:MAG: beta-ketoacyl-ACP synthase [Ideonella sp.]|nr:beta-ketoacyl-ACP synthase [Ideonella sp.]MCC7455671.1 beta-ketoacyl-ACP synthase [Nitrospira sp.]